MTEADINNSEIEKEHLDNINWEEEKYQVMPSLSEDEYNSLRDKIEEEGFQKKYAITIDENGHPHDGHHRCKICDELGISHIWVVREEGMTEEEKIKSAYKENTVRRNLGNGEKREAAKNFYLNHYSGESLRDVAELIGVSRGTVANAKDDLNEVEPGEFEEPSTLDSKDESDTDQSKGNSDIAPESDGVNALRDMVDDERIIAAARLIESESDSQCGVCGDIDEDR